MQQHWLQIMDRSRRSFTVLLPNTIIYEPLHFRTKAKEKNQGRYKKINGIPKVFGLFPFFASVAMSDTNYIIP